MVGSGSTRRVIYEFDRRRGSVMQESAFWCISTRRHAPLMARLALAMMMMMMMMKKKRKKKRKLVLPSHLREDSLHCASSQICQAQPRHERRLHNYISQQWKNMVVSNFFHSSVAEISTANNACGVKMVQNPRIEVSHLVVRG